MRSLGLTLAALLAPTLALGPFPFSRNALAFGVVPDVTLFKDALSDDKPAVRLYYDYDLQPYDLLL